MYFEVIFVCLFVGTFMSKQQAAMSSSTQTCLYCCCVCLLWLLQQCQTYPIEFRDEEWSAHKDVKYTGPHYVTRGSEIRITCQMSNFKMPMWSLNDENILSTSRRSRYQTDSVEGSKKSRMELLIIHNITEDDEGYYRCHSDSRNAHFVHVLPQDGDNVLIEHFNNTRKTIQFIDHNQNALILTCLLPYSKFISGIQWYKQGIFIGPDKRHQFYDTKMFILNATSQNDSGQYHCRNVNDKSFHGHTIDVYGEFFLYFLHEQTFFSTQFSTF